MLQSQLFAGDVLLQTIADDGDRISQSRHRKDPAVGKVQQALLLWDPTVLPRFGADGTFGGETAAAVRLFKGRELGVPVGEIVDDVGPRTVIRLDEIALAAEQPPPTGVRLRADVTKMRQDAAAWDERLLAYALGVARMKEERPTDPVSWHWSYQTQVHGAGTDPGDGLRHQCQHNSWFFLPWHRMYLAQFEKIIRAAIAGEAELSDDVKATWALPYWDYDRPGTGVLPFAFRTPTLPDGRPNALFDAERGTGINDLASPVALDPLVASSANWIRSRPFSGPVASFGGAPTGFNHFREFPGNAPGTLEIAPHGSVHNHVGGASGKMRNFDRAAGDAIFWLHHGNIDRLWEVWRIEVGAGADSTDPAYLGFSFTFRDDTGTIVPLTPGDVVDTVTQLGYRYEDTSRPASAPPVPGGPPVPANAPRLVGSIERTVSLVAAATEPVQVTLADMPAVLDEGERVNLLIEHITAEGVNLPQYGVFLDPDGDDVDSIFVGVMPFFGIDEANAADGDHELSYAFDVTDVVRDLLAEGRFDLSLARFRFRPVNEQAMEATSAELVAAPATVNLGSISLFVT